MASQQNKLVFDITRLNRKELQITKATGNFSLHPDHLDDLRRSGLSNETIEKARIHSICPEDIKKILGPAIAPKVSSLLAFPYPFCDGFIRYKLFPPVETRDGTIRYFQAPGSKNHLYFPPGVESILGDASVELYLVEGEKKALKAYQEGLACIGLGGLWNWSNGNNGDQEKTLISDFDRIKFENRTVIIVPDNDWLEPNRHGERKNLLQAVYELGYLLIDRGAKVFVIELPKSPWKIGLDDYLCQYGVDGFHALPKRPIRKQTIEEMIQQASPENLKEILKRLVGLPETERAVHINALAKKLNITKRSIQKDIQSLLKKGESLDIDHLLEAGANPQLNFSAQNFIDGVLSFGAILGNQRILVCSDGKILPADSSNKGSFRFKRSTLTAKAIKRFRAGEDVDGKDLLSRIQTLFSDHIVFKDPRIPLLLATWIMGTYLYKIFSFYGYLLFTSPVKRCGKSLALDIVASIAFNATTRMVNPSEASTFREVSDNSSTLVIDEVESLSDADREKRSEMISLLNAGFQRGAQVARVESRGGEFINVYFDAYSPKALAGIKSVTDTIEDRSFKISMIRRAKSETVKRFNPRILETHLEKIREDCFIWALRHAEDVWNVYRENPKIAEDRNLDDRLRDISEPLFTIGLVIDAQAGDELAQTVKMLVDLVVDLGKDREDQEDLSGSIPAVVNLMAEILGEEEERFISTDDLFAKFQEDSDLSFIQSKRGLAFFLLRLGLPRTRPRRIGDRGGVRGYVITREWIDDLGDRYT